MTKTTSLALLLTVATTASASFKCPSGWKEFDNSCFKIMANFLFSKRLSWENARAVCLGFGGDLVTINNKTKERIFSSESSGYNNLWIGLNDRHKEGEFVWSDGTPFNSSVYNNWLDGEPNNLGNEDCVELVRHGTLRWNDGLCSEKRFYICERPKGKLSCPVGWFLNGLSCYKASEQLMQWCDAKQDCHASGGYLMKIDDAAEQHFIETYMRITELVQVDDYVWIGLNDIEHEGNFTWEVDNSTANFTNWYPGQPNNGGNKAHCVGVGANFIFGQWNDLFCTELYLYICEKPAKGISCYQCSSNTSFADCAKKQEIVNCAFPRNYCFKQKNTAGEKKDQEAIFNKGCTSADKCRQWNNNWLECCEDNLCNADVACYQCSSNISFADCTRNQTRVNCTLQMSRCVKAAYTSKENDKNVTYYKGCATTDQCTETAERTFVECCTDDMCNKESGLSCFECSSTVSHEECQKHHKEVRCKSSKDDRCYYASIQQTSQDGASVTKLFKHGCTNNYYCNNTEELFSECDTYSGRCDMRCCSENLCNEAKKEDVPTQEKAIPNTEIAVISFGVAFILMLPCFVVAFWRYKKSVAKRMKSSSQSRREIISLDKWELLPEQIEYEEELGRGAFGVVYKAILKKRPGIEVFDTREGLETKKAGHVVAVKELQDDPSELQKEEFLFEIAMMKLLGAHQNIVSLVGCCTLQEHKFLVIEYVPFGDLLQWLRRKRRTINERQMMEKWYDEKDEMDGRESKPCQDIEVVQEETEYDHVLTDQTPVKMEPTLSYDNEACIIDESASPLDQENIELSLLPSTSKERDQTSEHLLSAENIDDEIEAENLGDGSEEKDSFTTQQLFSFAWQIAKGMNHLAEKNFVHRDLAARNILVGKDNQVKVSDFGLMRQIYEDVYSAKKTKKLPVKWMAPESIQDSVFTTKSDIWSYGILLWEMATMGGAPYPTMSNAQMCRALRNGYRMERPDMCCDEAYELMTECWREDPTARPSFSQLIDRLETVMTSDVPYCDVSKHDETSPYYNVPAKDDEDSG